MNRWVLLGIVIFLLAGIFATPKWSPEQEQAIEIGREFFEGVGLQTGKVLSIGVIDEVPAGYLFYWHSANGLEIPDVAEPELCWVVRFEQGSNPGHWWEVLIDVNAGEVVGGMSCR
ncbi:MAG: hypothetical protein OEU97_01585 [Dehalococcoidia bacterium]|nr:hypothetical protein [Dehalococcoidia bacterium]MDH4367049.1 hypothetical protein [Dehalococcoidia bacterium]